MLFSMLGWLLLDLLRSRAQVTRALERFRVLGTALESSPVAVVITDSEGFIDWVNPQYERNCGYTLEEGQGAQTFAGGERANTPATYQPWWGPAVRPVVARHLHQPAARWKPLPRRSHLVARF